MRPPQYLEQVETYIGLPFFSDPALGEQVRIDPAQLPPEELEPRATLYFAALRLLRSERRAQSTPLSPDDQTQPDRTRAIGTIRGELMTIDEGLETPAVRALREALASSTSEEPRPPVPPRTREHRGAGPADVLPVWALPSQAVNSIVNMSSGGVLVAMRHRGMEVPKLKLAGSRTWEACCDWEFVREMTELHGLRPELVGEIDLDRLPRSRDDDDPDRHDYARQLQLRFVPQEKLRNIPELVPLLPPEPTYPLVRPYHISRAGLSRVLGGGYGFIDAYCKEHSIGFIPLRIARSGAVGRFMLFEEAAQIWGIYSSIKLATPDDITLIQAASEVDVSKGFFRDELTPDEVAVLTDMRALRPKGRVLPHLPAEVALRAMDRLRRGPLPPHLVPAQVLDKYFGISYSGIMRASYDLQVYSTRRRLIGTDKTQSCFSWGFVRTLKEQRKVALREGEPTIDFGRLPMDEFDLDPDRIEYARHVQSLLVNHPDQVDRTPVEEWVTARRRAMSEKISAVSTTPVAEESKPALQAPRHDPELPGSWRPSVTESAGALIGTADALTAPEIATRLGISVAEVRQAARRIDPGDFVPHEVVRAGLSEPVYQGHMLSAVRDQLVGVQLQTALLLFGAGTQQLEWARRYVTDSGYTVFDDDYCSPWAFRLLCEGLTALGGTDKSDV